MTPCFSPLFSVSLFSVDTSTCMMYAYLVDGEAEALDKTG
jgi:hypothetical protein